MLKEAIKKEEQFKKTKKVNAPISLNNFILNPLKSNLMPSFFIQ